MNKSGWWYGVDILMNWNPRSQEGKKRNELAYTRGGLVTPKNCVGQCFELEIEVKS